MAPGLRSLHSRRMVIAQSRFLGASHVLDASHLPDSFSISYGECERTIRGKESPMRHEPAPT